MVAMSFNSNKQEDQSEYWYQWYQSTTLKVKPKSNTSNESGNANDKSNDNEKWQAWSQLNNYMLTNKQQKTINDHQHKSQSTNKQQQKQEANNQQQNNEQHKQWTTITPWRWQYGTISNSQQPTLETVVAIVIVTMTVMFIVSVAITVMIIVIITVILTITVMVIATILGNNNMHNCDVHCDY